MIKEKNSDLQINTEEKSPIDSEQDKDILPNQVPETEKSKEKKEKKRVHKKPIALKDLENKNRLLSLKKKKIQGTTSEELKTEDISNLLDNETNTIFNRQWNKLEKGLKCNRINQYLHSQEEYSLSDSDKSDLKKLLYNTINKGGLTKNTDVSYNKDEGKIIKINTLIFDETKRKFHIKNETAKKQKSNSKSKSNIERLLKR